VDPHQSSRQPCLGMQATVIAAVMSAGTTSLHSSPNSIHRVQSEAPPPTPPPPPPLPFSPTTCAHGGTFCSTRSARPAETAIAAWFVGAAWYPVQFCRPAWRCIVRRSLALGADLLGRHRRSREEVLRLFGGIAAGKGVEARSAPRAGPGSDVGHLAREGVRAETETGRPRSLSLLHRMRAPTPVRMGLGGSGCLLHVSWGARSAT
jgi:hypothetical protein